MRYSVRLVVGHKSYYNCLIFLYFGVFMGLTLFSQPSNTGGDKLEVILRQIAHRAKRPDIFSTEVKALNLEYKDLESLENYCASQGLTADSVQAKANEMNIGHLDQVINAISFVRSAQNSEEEHQQRPKS